MQILTDSCLALLAAVGIWTLGRMALDWILGAGEKPEILFLLRAMGDGSGLEQAAYKLLRSWRGREVLLVDCGLNECGRARSNALAEKERDIHLCRPADLENLVREADIWMKSGNKTK